MGNVTELRPKKQPLKCPGIGRDAENAKAIVLYFSRPLTDDEMRFMHEVAQRSAPLIANIKKDP